MSFAISVDGTPITERQIGLEAQYHPAPCLEKALHEAARALVVRQLLLAEARRRGLSHGDFASERETHDAIRRLTEGCVPVPRVGEAECLAYYEAHPDRFKGPALFDPSHILFATSSDDPEYEMVRTRARQTLFEIQQNPSAFEAIARSVSACPSAVNGGRLGQTTEGETAPEFEAILRELRAGELASDLVATKHGFHIVRLDHRAESSRLPFEAVKDKIRIYLRDKNWRVRIREFITELGSQATILGFVLDAPAPEPAAAPIPVEPRTVPRRLRVLN